MAPIIVSGPPTFVTYSSKILKNVVSIHYNAKTAYKKTVMNTAALHSQHFKMAVAGVVSGLCFAF